MTQKIVVKTARKQPTKKNLQAQKDFYQYQLQLQGISTDFLEVDNLLSNEIKQDISGDIFI